MNPFPNGSNFKFAKGNSSNTKRSSAAQMLLALKFLNTDVGKKLSEFIFLWTERKWRLSHLNSIKC